MSLRHLILLIASNITLIRSIINCNSGEDCNIPCTGDRACVSETIQCPKDYKCIITCTGTSSCVGSTFNGSMSSELLINGCTDNNTCSRSEIYCPANINDTKKCSISGNDNLRHGIKYYAINGWADINIVNYTGDFSKQSSIMYCLSDYSIFCTLYTNSFECDPNGDTSCNNGITTLIPTLYPTTQPTLSPISTLSTTYSNENNTSYESLFGLGTVFGFDVLWIVIIGLGAAICCIGCGLCYYMITQHQNEKELANTVKVMKDTIELKPVDSNINMSGINTNPLGNGCNATLSAVSSMTVYQNTRVEKPKVPLYYGAAVNNQTTQHRHQTRPAAMDRFYPQSSVESNASTQNTGSANQQSNGSQKSMQSQSSNVNLFQNSGPHSYPQQMNNYHVHHAHHAPQQMQNNNLNYNHATYQNQIYPQQNGFQQHSQQHLGNIPNVHVHSQQQQQRQPRSYAPPYPNQPQSYPQQNRLMTNQPIQIIKPGLKPIESVVSDATTATTSSVDVYSEDSLNTSEYSSTDGNSDHGNHDEPPTPSVNQVNHLQSPVVMITVTNEYNAPARASGISLKDINSGSSYASYTDSSYQDSPISDDEKNNNAPNPSLDDMIVNNVNNNDNDIDDDMLDNMAELLEFQDINCGNETPLSTQTMVVHDANSQVTSPSIDTPNINKFPKTRGILVVLNED